MAREPQVTPAQVDEHNAELLHGQLPSGREVSVRVVEGREELLIQGKDGLVELQVVLTPEGPLLRMPAARLHLEASEELRLSARRVRVEAEEKLDLQSQGEMDIRSTGDTRMQADADVRVTGALIYLN